jgi:hypothetical protein
MDPSNGAAITLAQVAELQAKWKLLIDPPTCEHPNQELEASETGYLTGNYHCTTCGEPVVKKL